MTNIIENIKKKTREFLPDDTYFIVDVKVKGVPGNKKVEVFIDGDLDVDINTCSAISRKLSASLDETDILEGNYSLEVSSPGVDHPLVSIRQYRKNIGRKLKIVLKDHDVIEGELLKVDDLGITVNKKGKKPDNSTQSTYIQFGDIDKAKVLIAFK